MMSFSFIAVMVNYYNHRLVDELNGECPNCLLPLDWNNNLLSNSGHIFGNEGRGTRVAICEDWSSVREGERRRNNYFREWIINLAFLRIKSSFLLLVESLLESVLPWHFISSHTYPNTLIYLMYSLHCIFNLLWITSSHWLRILCTIKNISKIKEAPWTLLASPCFIHQAHISVILLYLLVFERSHLEL